ncbi:hypothetical protein I316_00185 [Kwoniella heveanensis BCC8398]|uniref:RING-type domain-containing protein n=1 Tax=Kwoniella heveanensis BCC8398 TaxID=1296120 RepID=A0A1B9H3W2_9TREE|nr:hypothetical protein I316_00185 [Kwoniella heveanensis BCC8398]
MPGPSPFWLCHECGAQMRPILRDSVPHCASCDGEFIEILDPEVNPDPFHDLPPAPPTRPGASTLAAHSTNAPLNPSSEPGEGGGSFLSSLFGNILGAAAGHGSSQNQNAGGQRNTEAQSAPSGSGSSPNRGQVPGGSRTFQFNFPGGGRGQVVFGSFGGGMGPFGPTGQQGGGVDFESFFPQGFGQPLRPGARRQDSGQPLGPGDPMDGSELLRALMTIIGEEGGMPPNMFFGGPGGNGNFGDYATSEQGFNDILERLMQAAGPQGPLPASDIVIEGLPRFKFDDEKKLAESVYKDCPVCKDDFAVGDEVVRIPCAHIFHPDCLVPWLKTNGSCPVCRFSLVPEEEDRARSSGPGQAPSTSQNQQSQSPPAAAETGQSTMTSILNRLFGQSGATSNPTSPTATEHTHTPFGAAGEAVRGQEQGQSSGSASSSSSTRPAQMHEPAPFRDPSPPPYHSDFGAMTSPRAATPPATSGQPTGNQTGEEQSNLSSNIPEDYRARHRERERAERQRESHTSDE